MKLLIDSVETKLPIDSSSSFMDFCNKLMASLLEKNLSISSIKIDGKSITDIEEMQTSFLKAQSIEVETTTVKKALQSALFQQYTQASRMTQDCESLVTDCLLDEPQMIMDKWLSLSERLKTAVAFVPTLAPFLKDEQVDHLIDKNFEELNQIIREITEVLNKADVVKFSDILEMKLQPWLKTFSLFLQEQVAQVDSLKDSVDSPQKVS